MSLPRFLSHPSFPRSCYTGYFQCYAVCKFSCFTVFSNFQEGCSSKTVQKIVIITKAKHKKRLILEGGSLPEWSQHRTCNLKSCSDYKMDLFPGGPVLNSN